MITSMIKYIGDEANHKNTLSRIYNNFTITSGDATLRADSIVNFQGYDVYIFNNNYRGTDYIQEIHLTLYRDPQGISTVGPLLLAKSLEVAAFVLCTRILLLGDYINPNNNIDRSRYDLKTTKTYS